MTSPSERPAAAPDLYGEADVRAAARSLLRTPFLYAEAHADELAQVRRHQTELVRLFADGLGYRLVVEPRLARLFKTGLTGDATRGLVRRNGAPFTPRRYALLALTLAALTRVRRQLMIDELVAGVRAAAADAGMGVDLDSIQDRRTLHSALVALVDLGVLSERDGDLDHWVDRHTESLLDVHPDRLALLITAPLSACAGPSDLLREAAAPSAAGGARVAVRRRLTERPVLSVDELTDEQRGWWSRNREREREWFRRSLGLDLELRSEGALAIDDGGELTDVAFPSTGSANHFALLLLADLVDVVRTSGISSDGVAWARLAASTARAAGDRIFATWQGGLRKDHRQDPDGVYGEALAILVAVGLVRLEDDGVLVHAAGARYAPRPEFLNAVGPAGELSLFEEDT